MQFKSIHSKIAFEAIKEYLESDSTKIIENQSIPDEFQIKRSCFVTIKDKKGKLKGCIGTIKPSYENLYQEIIKNAVSSATKDTRFNNLSIKELNNIQISVEVLSEPVEIDNIELLDPKIYGLIITEGSYKKGVLLPNIKGVDTIEEQIRIVKKKAYIKQKNNYGLKFYRFKTKKYY